MRIGGKAALLREKAGTWKKKKYEIAAVLLCLAVLSVFVARKQGFHMDELLSFELSNAEFNPWIVPTQPEGRLAKFVHNEIDGETFGETLENLAATVQDVLENRGDSKLLSYRADVYPEPVWITAEQFKDYIQVDGKDAFNYLSVYFNVKDDNHPPLHFMLLHTVSSLFQGRSEAWMGCLINLGAIAVVLVLLMKLGETLASAFGFGEKKKTAGIICALLYGISTGAVATTLLIRMYGLLTLWCAAYFYIVLKKWESGEFHRRNFSLILVTLLGFWTQYFFLFYCILLALVVSVLLLWQKKTENLWGFVRSMAAAAVVGVGLFPFSVSDVFSSGRGVEAIGNLSAGFSGYGMRLLAFLKILLENTFHPLFWALLVFLAVCGVFVRRAGKEMSQEGVKKPRERTSLLWMSILPPTGYFLLAARMSPYLVDRYIMPVFPFMILLGGLLLTWLLWVMEKYLAGKKLRWSASLICGLVLALQVVSVLGYDGRYLYQGYGLQEHIAESNADYPCICIYDGVGYYENLLEFTHYEKTLLLTLDQLENRQERGSIMELEKVAVLVKGSDTYEVMGQALDILTEQYDFALEKFGWRGLGEHGDILVFMRKDA